MNKYYPHLYEPLKIGTLTLRNRIVASVSSQNDIEPDGTLSLHNIAYYARKAKGGASLVTVGDGIVHPTGKDHPNQVYLFTDNCLPSLTRCAEGKWLRNMQRMQISVMPEHTGGNSKKSM